MDLCRVKVEKLKQLEFRKQNIEIFLMSEIHNYIHPTKKLNGRREWGVYKNGKLLINVYSAYDEVYPFEKNLIDVRKFLNEKYGYNL